jgi:hypothetical protein
LSEEPGFDGALSSRTTADQCNLAFQSHDDDPFLCRFAGHLANPTNGRDPILFQGHHRIIVQDADASVVVCYHAALP